MATETVRIKEFRYEDTPLSCTVVVIGGPGSGKCLAKDTPVIMYDGTTKFVQNIVEGDLLMGDDSTPRRVLGTTSGVDNMFRINQTKGMTYVVNEPHILVLKRNYAPFDVIEISVADYLSSPVEDVEAYKGYNTTNDELSDITIEPVGRGTYYGFELNGNGRFLLGDTTVTHNTSLAECLFYYLKHRYPTARAFIGTQSGFDKFCKIFHPLYVSNKYDLDEEKRHIARQRLCEQENGHGYIGNYAINFIDDCSDDPRIYKHPTMRGLFKLGSQHYNQLAVVGSQYAIDMPPDVRKAISYVVLFKEKEEDELKKLYKNFGGICGTYQRFCDIMDQITGDYTAVVINKRSQILSLESDVTFIRTTILKPWKFGCKEYRQWAEERYNKDYVEQIEE